MNKIISKIEIVTAYLNLLYFYLEYFQNYMFTPEELSIQERDRERNEFEAYKTASLNELRNQRQ